MTDLLPYILRGLRIAWASASEKELLQDLICEGQAFLMKYDPSIDWQTDNVARPLLLEYVRYARASARDEFKTNYAEELLSLTHGAMARKAHDDAEESK